MKAYVYDKKSAPDFLSLRDLEAPHPRDDQVLVEVRAVSINAADYRSMALGIVPKNGIYGADVAGKVVEVGGMVRKFKVGDSVVGDLSGCGFGGFAQYVAAPEKALAMKPEGLSYEVCAALPMASVTALQALRNLGKIREGAKVLINGASGGVGSFAVQLAKYFGAEVTGVCSSANVDRVRSLGADRVIDYSAERLEDNREEYDLILVVHGNNPLSLYRRMLRDGGIHVQVGGAISQIIGTMLLGPVYSLFGTKRMANLIARPSVEDLAFILDLVVTGKIRVDIEKEYPFGELPQALAYVMTGHARGKQVIRW